MAATSGGGRILLNVEDTHVERVSTPVPKNRASKPRLVAVSEIPKSTRRSIYVELVEEFAKCDLQNAKIESVKVGAAISVKKAIASLGLKNVAAVTANGEVYLTKK
jgi:hypothetical protein